ncbi:hypothetical protein HYPSUDRAFT_51251 [Hypholoma sublateritium FD-334 SS-4]|uniref:Uncharacterized protein n=1 Tax=Hypholoma sublateritium (strain FD-334 SS-4) TaxID=945553 RepID=A0A0D2Q9W2_HYPSF|nr:hypothetical protein HYPSUDRAFT_51251 [Hypholoma sublateritium FD-334 SS-4]
MKENSDTNLSGLNMYFRPFQCSTYQSFPELATTVTATKEKDQNNYHQSSKAGCDDTQGYGSLVGRAQTNLFITESWLAAVFVLLLLIDIVCVAAEIVMVNNDVLTDVDAIANDCSAEENGSEGIRENVLGKLVIVLRSTLVFATSTSCVCETFKWSWTCPKIMVLEGSGIACVVGDVIALDVGSRTTEVVFVTIEADTEAVDAGESDCVAFNWVNENEDVFTDIVDVQALSLDPEINVASPTEDAEVVGTACCPDERMVTESIEDEFVRKSGVETVFSRVRVPEVTQESRTESVSQLELVDAEKEIYLTAVLRANKDFQTPFRYSTLRVKPYKSDDNSLEDNHSTTLRIWWRCSYGSEVQVSMFGTCSIGGRGWEGRIKIMLVGRSKDFRESIAFETLKVDLQAGSRRRRVEATLDTIHEDVTTQRHHPEHVGNSDIAAELQQFAVQTENPNSSPEEFDPKGRYNSGET